MADHKDGATEAQREEGEASGMIQLEKVSRYNPVKRLFDSWLTPGLHRGGGAPL